MADELFAVGVDLLDGHRGDDDAHLADDDLLGERLDFLHGQAEQARGGIFHDAFLRADADGERRGRIHADVLRRERALERHVKIHRPQIKVGIGLKDREDEGRPAIVAPAAALASDVAVNDQDAIGRAHLVAAEEADEQECDDEDGERGEDDEIHGKGVELGESVHSFSTSNVSGGTISRTITATPLGMCSPERVRAGSVCIWPWNVICTWPPAAPLAGMLK